MEIAPLIFLAAMVAIFWFLLIRPQRQRQAAVRSMVAALSPGDEVITVGGIIGTIRTIEDDHLLLEVAPGTQIRLAKEAVATVRPKDAGEAPTPQEDG